MIQALVKFHLESTDKLSPLFSFDHNIMIWKSGHWNCYIYYIYQRQLLILISSQLLFVILVLEPPLI